MTTYEVTATYLEPISLYSTTVQATSVEAAIEAAWLECCDNNEWDPAERRRENEWADDVMVDERAPARFTIGLLHEFYPDADDDPDNEEEVRVVATLGPYGNAYISADAVYGDGDRVAHADGVNPGMWLNGALTDVPVTGFHIRGVEPQ